MTLSGLKPVTFWLVALYLTVIVETVNKKYCGVFAEGRNSEANRDSHC
jgi:hypothetical protein